MLREEKKRPSSICIPGKLAAGLRVLREAFDYAQDVGSESWAFAVSLKRLEQLGFNLSDVRWLTLKGMVEHGREVTVVGDDGRQFLSTGNLTFCDSSCVVLTEFGANQLSTLRLDPSLAAVADVTSTGAWEASAGWVETGSPSWDPLSRRLSFDGSLVKRFKWPAANQEAVLCAFQEEGWPERIDDPLSPQPAQDTKRRLADTIKCLNRKHSCQLIRFHGDGTGEGVVWGRRESQPFGEFSLQATANSAIDSCRQSLGVDDNRLK